MIESKGTPVASSAFLHPVFSHRWGVFLRSDENNILTIQAKSCLINMKKSEMILTVEQPAERAQEILNLIGSLAKGSREIKIKLLDGHDNAVAIIGGYAELIDHEFLLDYSLFEIATHKLTFNYQPTVI